MAKTSIALFAAALVVLVAQELFVNMRARGGMDRTADAGSLRRITHLRNIAFLVGVASAYYPVLPLPGGRSADMAAGAILMLCGLMLRWWAIAKLGIYFTGAVMTQECQKLVMDGPYRHVRHPAYTGAMLFYLGFGVAMGSVVGTVLITALMTHGFLNRIRVEERVMTGAFPDEYADYMKKTKRIIPYIY